MTEYFFGQSLVRSFYPTGGDGLPINLPTQSPEVFLFSAQPSLEDAIAGIGAMSTIAAWTESATSPYGRTINYPPVYDPEPSSQVGSRGYWEVVKFKYHLGGQAQSKLNYFEVRRPAATSEVPGTTRAQVVAIYPTITDYITNDEIDDFIDLAERLTRVDLEASGDSWDSYTNLSNLYLAIAYRAIAEFSLSEFRSGTDDDRFWKRAELFSSRYNGLVAKANLKVDTTGDGAPDRTAAPTNKAWRVSR